MAQLEKRKISIVLPTFNEEGNIALVVQTLDKVLKDENFEAIFVNDGSSDNTLDVIKDLSSRDSRIKYLSFTRNFGHQNALLAGIDNATGDCLITLDADLQHPVELIPEMIQSWKKGYKIVYTKRIDGKDISKFKKFTSRVFYKILNLFSEVKIESSTPDFRLLDRQVIDEIKNLKEYQFFLRGFIPWLGFKQKSIPFTPAKRTWGESGYTFKKMFKLALTGLTSFSSKPLTLFASFGFAMVIPSFLYGLYAIWIKVFSDGTISGWTSILASVLFLGGIQLISLSVIGYYIGNIFLEVKKRPRYLIEEKNF